MALFQIYLAALIIFEKVETRFILDKVKKKPNCTALDPIFQSDKAQS